MDKHQTRTRAAAIAAAALVSLGASGLTACGDNDKEGPAEEVGKATDQAVGKAGHKLDKAEDKVDKND